MFLLDTCVVSELLKPRPNPGVVQWIRQHDEHLLHLSVLTPGELAKGIAKHPDRVRRDKLQRWLDHELLPRFAGRIVHITLAISLRWGELQGRCELSGLSLPMIAATALETRAAVVTRNVGDFAPTGVDTIDPWSSSA